MKLAIYSDVHYSTVEITNKNRRPSLSAEKIPRLNEIFRKNDVDAVLCLGDIINSEGNREKDAANLTYIMGLMRECGSPLYTLPGNHDFETLTADEYYSASGQLRLPYHVDLNGCRFVFLDCCYSDRGEPYGDIDFDWKNSYMPDGQLEYLVKVAKNAEQVYVCTHQNLDERDNPHCIRNAERVRRALAECRNIKGVFSGHYHHGCEFNIDGIPYITPAALCEGEGISYIFYEI